ncbi:MAG: UxaA family hydrolase [Acidobacteria bacterium]|nr:UxaA family hydrolase [Acidobacteriota bacterium]
MPERSTQDTAVGGRVDFIVPEPGDGVGVVVAEGVQVAQELRGWVLDTDETPTLRALDAAPFGHKIALVALARGETIIEYGMEIGQATAAIRKGCHVHVHNVTSKRWSK